MVRPFCRGSGMPGKLLQPEFELTPDQWRRQYQGVCPVCGRVYRMTVAERLYNHKVIAEPKQDTKRYG